LNSIQFVNDGLTWFHKPWRVCE